jgi:hypothetical protein
LLVLATVAIATVLWLRYGMVWAIARLVLYPVLGVVVERFCEAMFRWAAHDGLEWDLGTRNVVGAVWPVALLVSLLFLPPLDGP